MTARVLLVDDAADIRLLYRVALEGAGFEVEDAAGGAAALAALADGPRPHVVLLDVQMPDLDGWDTLIAIRRDFGDEGPAVVMCSVRSQAADRARGLALGCDAFLSKPFRIDHVVATVAAIARMAAADRRGLRAASLAAVLEEVG